MELDTLPILAGDALQLRQVFQNLINNALKFSRVDAAGAPSIPHITIRTQRIFSSQLPLLPKPTREAEAYHQVDISDNGVGFDEKYLDRIFQVFQRLHGTKEFAGTGIGLAICQRVVNYHGGLITATSQLGQGATFSVYLPV